MLSKRGRLHFVGVILEPMTLSVCLDGRPALVSSSPVGSPAMLATMLDFAARHRIYPQVEGIPFGAGKRSYRTPSRRRALSRGA